MIIFIENIAYMAINAIVVVISAFFASFFTINLANVFLFIVIGFKIRSGTWTISN